MPSRDPGQRLDDMLENILAIRSFTAGMDDQKFIEDKKTRATIERRLPILERVVRLGLDRL